MPWSGFSEAHSPDGVAVNTANGSGSHNVQMFILSADGTVLTCMQGFWNATDVVSELQLAEDLNKVWLDPNLTKVQKDSIFRSMQLHHIARHSQQEAARSHMQGFDQQFEAEHRPNSDLIAGRGADGKPVFKTTDVIMHERMARQPFVPYGDFNTAAFVDYGKEKYDKGENKLKADGSAKSPSLEGVLSGWRRVL